MIIEYPTFDKKVFLKSFFAKTRKPQVITSRHPSSKWPHYTITQLNSVITSEFAAMKRLTYIDFFLLPQLGTNRIKSFSNNIHFSKIQKTRPLKQLNHQSKFCERHLS